jgi:NTP pyrophosphatase (non-canonical NTP hydrolase)
MSEINELIRSIVEFRDERDWKQFHNPKDLALALSIEASELLEVYLWKKPEHASISKVKEELADVLTFSLLIAHHYDLNVSEIIQDKIKINQIKYPVDKSKGTSKKYDEL